MAYNDVASMAVNAQLQNRVTACAAVEGQDGPQYWMSQNIWEVVAAPGWGEAWRYALDSGMDPAVVGSNETVISDPMILAQVQAVRGGP